MGTYHHNLTPGSAKNWAAQVWREEANTWHSDDGGLALIVCDGRRQAVGQVVRKANYEFIELNRGPGLPMG